MTQCKGTTKFGKRCKKSARPGTLFCWIHTPCERNQQVVPKPQKPKQEQSVDTQVEDDLITLQRLENMQREQRRKH